MLKYSNDILNLVEFHLSGNHLVAQTSSNSSLLDTAWNFSAILCCLQFLSILYYNESNHLSRVHFSWNYDPVSLLTHHYHICEVRARNARSNFSNNFHCSSAIQSKCTLIMYSTPKNPVYEVKAHTRSDKMRMKMLLPHTDSLDEFCFFLCC